MSQAATAAGNVYVFNVFSQSLTVSTNGHDVSAGEIPEWTVNAEKAKYRPNSVPVPRVLNPSEGTGKFFNGKNAVTLTWLDGLYLATIPIDGDALPLNQDLLLFFERNSWQMVTQFGAEISRGEVTPYGDMKNLLAAAGKG